MKLYVFNPDTDLALAHNDENYLAPASIRRMAHDLALLPVWYAQPGSFVLASSAYNADYLKKMRALFPLSVELITEPELVEDSDMEILPWGWNPALRKRLLKLGAPERCLPSAEYIAEYRNLSSREKGAEVLVKLEEKEENFYCGQSYRLQTLSSCRSFIESQEACVLKAPWSGSGKGLNWCQGVFTKSIEGWCEHVLKEQGLVMGEPLFNKVKDFAMEFYSNGHEVAFVGYSLFTTNRSGAYNGNDLLSSSTIEKQIEVYVPREVIVDIRKKLCVMLAEICSNLYVGYLGVDMMVCLLPDESYAIHPCVEINMRMNMGLVSYLFREKFMIPESVGKFFIEYIPSSQHLRAKHELDLIEHPLVIENGKLLSGYLPLVPVTPTSVYRAYVLV